MIQQILAWGIGLLAVAWLVVRSVRRRSAGTCCGERECPAATDMLRRLRDARR